MGLLRIINKGKSQGISAGRTGKIQGAERNSSLGLCSGITQKELRRTTEGFTVRAEQRQEAPSLRPTTNPRLQINVTFRMAQ